MFSTISATSAMIVTTLVLLGQLLELRARSRTGAAIQSVLSLAPKTARRVSAIGNGTTAPESQALSGMPELLPLLYQILQFADDACLFGFGCPSDSCINH